MNQTRNITQLLCMSSCTHYSKELDPFDFYSFLPLPPLGAIIFTEVGSLTLQAGRGAATKCRMNVDLFYPRLRSTLIELRVWQRSRWVTHDTFGRVLSYEHS
jgi:hypothetical protein